MLLALPVLKRQLCLNPQLRYFLASGRRPLSTLTTTTPHPQSEQQQTSPSIPTSSPSTAPLDASPKPKKKSKKASARKPKVPVRNLLDESKIQTYLDEIAETSNTVTLTDITRLRPSGHSNPHTEAYATEHQALVNRLCSSFSMKQLERFGQMMEIERYSRGTTKDDYATRIIEGAWKWPSLTEMQEKKRDRIEVDHKSFPMDPRQAFLILGKDGANLHTLSRKYNAYVGFTTNPTLSLNVEGLRGNIKPLTEHIAAFKEDIVEDYHNISAKKPIPTEWLQRISRLSGAFVEQFGEGQIRISWKKDEPRSVFIAKRLVTHILCDMESVSRSSILAHVPPEAPSSASVLSLLPHDYALYPFLSSRSLPWNVKASGAFRARKVSEWIGINSMEDVQKTGGLELARGRLVDLEGNTTNIRQNLFNHLPDQSESRSRVISASLGHFLVTPPPSSGTSYNAPLKGTWPLSKLLNWVREEHVGSLFIPSVPAPVIQSKSQNQRQLHRLLYEARPTRSTQQAADVLEFEMVLPLATVNEDGVPEFAKAKLSPSEDTFTAEASKLERPLDNICRIGQRSTVDLMLPDRPMDIRFSIFDSTVIPGTLWPAALQKYFKDLSFFFYDGEPDASPPNAPVIIQQEDKEYRLRSSVRIRQSQSDAVAPQLNFSVPAITENILDLEVDDKSTHCKIACAEPFTEEKWRLFLKACDFLSATRAPSLKKTRFIDADNPDITI